MPLCVFRRYGYNTTPTHLRFRASFNNDNMAASDLPPYEYPAETTEERTFPASLSDES